MRIVRRQKYRGTKIFRQLINIIILQEIELEKILATSLKIKNVLIERDVITLCHFLNGDCFLK